MSSNGVWKLYIFYVIVVTCYFSSYSHGTVVVLLYNDIEIYGGNPLGNPTFCLRGSSVVPFLYHWCFYNIEGPSFVFIELFFLTLNPILRPSLFLS